MSETDVKGFVYKKASELLGVTQDQISDDTQIQAPRTIFSQAIFQFRLQAMKVFLPSEGYTVGECIQIIESNVSRNCPDDEAKKS